MIINYALNYICDEVEPDRFKLNRSKIIKSIALAMLYVKGDYYLNEFVTALKHALELALPLDTPFTASVASVMADETMRDDTA